MVTIIILSVIHLIGINICFWMLLTEHKAEGQVYTNGDMVVCFLLSLGGWLTIAWNLIGTWVAKIRYTGYWDKPVNKEEEPKVTKLKKTA